MLSSPAEQNTTSPSATQREAGKRAYGRRERERTRPMSRLVALSFLLHHGVKREQHVQEGLQLGEGKDGGTVAQRPFWFFMNLHEQTINTHRDRRARQRGNEFTLPARLAS